jgi:predicted ATP-dependent Lon-type protease
MVTSAGSHAGNANEPSAVDKLRAILPKPVDVLAVVGGNEIRPLNFMELLQSCLKDAHDVLAYARTADGKVRNAKLLVSGSQHLLKTLEVAAKLQATMKDLAAIDRFHQGIIEEIMKESSELAERVLQRLYDYTTKWVS